MEIIKVNPGSNVFLGRQGENLAREIVFNIAPWVETYGQGNAQLLYRRKGDRDPYLVAVRQEGSEVHWSVSKPDTDVSGAGFYELHYYSGQTLVKSATGDTFVEGTMTAAMETPDPYKSWVDQVIEAAQSVPQTVEAALQEAKESGEFDGPQGDKGDQGDSAYDIAVKNGYEGTEEEWIADLYGKAVEAQKKAETAQFLTEQSKRQAEEAASRADDFSRQAKTSETNAKVSEEKARVSAQNAENAKSNLENAVELTRQMEANARQFRAEAADSAKAAKTSETNAKTSEINSKTSETNAAASAEEAKKAAEEAKKAGGVKTVNGQSPDENGNVEIEVGSGSGVEVTAKPGQLIRVKETDENGNPTAWEAVPWGYTEGGMVEILAPVSYTPTGGNNAVYLESPLNLVAGEEYIVEWNGTPYHCVATEINADGVSGVLIENAIFRVVEATINGRDIRYAGPKVDEEPFTVSIYQDNTVTHPIPGEFLPEGVPYVEEGEVVEILAECQPEYIEDEGMFLLTENDPPFVVGATYVVNWNGTEYTCVGQDLSAMAPGAVALGDLSVAIGGTSTGEPFTIVSAYQNGSQGLIIIPIDGTVELTLSIKSANGTIRKLDNRCLNLDWIPVKKYVKGAEVVAEKSGRVTNFGFAWLGQETPYNLTPGSTYVVVWNGVEYTAMLAPGDGENDYGIFNSDAFIIQYAYDESEAANIRYGLRCMPKDGSTEVTLSIWEAVSGNKLPEEFLPESVATKEYVNEMLGVIENGTY